MKEDFIIIFLTLSRSYPPFLSLATLSSAPAVSFFPWPSAVHETSLDDETTSTKTVIDWYNYCREACAHRIKNHHAGPIGRPGNTVEIDESKFEEMKYHRGRKLKRSGFLVAFAAKPRPASLSR